jgi:hypothetical protein
MKPGTEAELHDLLLLVLMMMMMITSEEEMTIGGGRHYGDKVVMSCPLSTTSHATYTTRHRHN